MLSLAQSLRGPSFARALHVSAALRAAATTPAGPPKASPSSFPVKAAPSKSPAVAAKGPAPKGPPMAFGIHCQSTRNNTIVTLTSNNNVVFWTTAGRCGFKGANRASYEAGYQCAKQTFTRVTELLERHPRSTIDLYFKGFGQGREAMRSALLAVEGQPLRDFVRTVTDRTPIKIGGPRSKKARRL